MCVLCMCLHIGCSGHYFLWTRLNLCGYGNLTVQGRLILKTAILRQTWQWDRSSFIYYDNFSTVFLSIADIENEVNNEALKLSYSSYSWLRPEEYWYHSHVFMARWPHWVRPILQSFIQLKWLFLNNAKLFFTGVPLPKLFLTGLQRFEHNFHMAIFSAGFYFHLSHWYDLWAMDLISNIF